MNRASTWIAVGTVAALLAGGAWLTWPELREREPLETHAVATPALIEKGRYVARAGNCIACHTITGETPFAGGRRIATPFGDVFSTNLTPDLNTGIGAWSAADFWRAMHYGKSRDGRRLYPAFPYANYTRVSRDDSDALFAYFQSLAPVSRPRVPATVRFPFNTQLAQLVWRRLYFKPGEFAVEPQRSVEWNRGAYLVEGLGHCNACHTARTWLGGTDDAAGYSGGSLPLLGWDALPLTTVQPLSDSAAAEMAELLAAGTSKHGVATGPMAEVVFHSLQHLEKSDIAAIVTYVRSLPPQEPRLRRFGPPVVPARRDELLLSGATVYAEHCADCHGASGEGEPYVYPALAGNRLVTAPSARNALQAVLFGGFAPSTAGNPRPHGMPPYADELSFEEVAAVLTYVRASWGNDASAVSPLAVRER